MTKILIYFFIALIAFVVIIIFIHKQKELDRATNAGSGLEIYYISGFGGYDLESLHDLPENSIPFFTIDDIQEWNWNKQIITLSEQGVEKIRVFEQKRKEEGYDFPGLGTGVLHVYLHGEEQYRAVLLSFASALGMKSDVPVVYEFDKGVSPLFVHGKPDAELKRQYTLHVFPYHFFASKYTGREWSKLKPEKLKRYLKIQGK